MRLAMVLDPTEAFRGFERMSSRSRRLGAAFADIKPHLRDDQREHAAKRAGPDGPWPARASGTSRKLARSTRRFKGRKRRKLARRPLGRLVSQVTFSASRAGVFGTSRVPWSNVHNTGGVVGRGAKLPARPFLWLSDELVTVAGNVIARHVADAFGGA